MALLRDPPMELLVVVVLIIVVVVVVIVAFVVVVLARNPPRPAANILLINISLRTVCFFVVVKPSLLHQAQASLIYDANELLEAVVDESVCVCYVHDLKLFLVDVADTDAYHYILCYMR
ncbi:unnamed protein product [Polarella glacialis]|uniref:Uncharacterized protein n=1 Tax=Polarella glacialis TaxID=89957 RepID=A0A813JHW0_POLGL|nr:unnamed protein product [Polarella glacialis]CAE8678631.1 unnamed protein product [Polarella glacialis]